ncbi:MAG TPA: RNA-binding cell elongation regulator Jag/EloR [Pseudogracilibacillus sp.]|nr:RNA-binding cell elongation regulator Jag/EloR [Pseudogracilibacillus sp.]
MREITASGETVEEAIESALQQLNIPEDRAEIEVIDEGKKGFLGLFGSVRAVVKVTEKVDNIEMTAQFLTEVSTNMGVDVEVEIEQEDNRVTFNLSGEKIALLIGRRGKTLNALQYLTQLVLNKQTRQFYAVTVDAEGYRKRREETLIDLAEKMADKVTRVKRKVTLEPMPAYERKIIHTALQDESTVSTYSHGNEPHRHIVIKPNK